MVTITPLQQIGLDERGGTYVFDTDGRHGQFMVTERKAGTVSGRHYHEGVSPNKNPEVLILTAGDIQLNWRNIKGEEQGSISVSAPAQIVVPAWVWHEVIALTDMVMLELNAAADGRGDTYRPG
jgi:dTDP-4-dehydrorhamnose 3,5-epimerase-like enzyme